MAYLWGGLALVTLLLRLLKAPKLPSREKIVLPAEERVLLLGASSGVGRDLAHVYAKRGARICLFARNADLLTSVKQECLALGLSESNVLVLAGDITSHHDLLRLRHLVTEGFGGIDTLHILAGVNSTTQLMGLTDLDLSDPSSPSPSNPSRQRYFTKDGDNLGTSTSTYPDEAGMGRLADEARRLSEINYVGTVLALGCFLPVLAESSASPVVHHLSSVAAAIPAPYRAIYAATKGAALQAFQSCRVECEGSGVRFFALLPGTIANGFRLKGASGDGGGRDETKLPIRHAWEKLLLQPDQVISSILDNLALNPKPAPSIPYPPFTWIKALDVPPPPVVFLPQTYFWAHLASLFSVGRQFVDRGARRKYGLPAM